MVANRAIFLDRDGVINKTIIIDKKPYAPRSLENFSIYKDAKWSVQKLVDCGFLIFIITNQPDVGNGLLKK